MNDLRPPVSLFMIIVFCLFSLLWTVCHPSPTTSFPLTPLPEINGEAISFLGDTLRHTGIDVAIFLQADSLLKAAADDSHDDSTVFNSTIYHGHPAETAAWRRYILCIGLWPSFGYLAAEADDEGLI